MIEIGAVWLDHHLVEMVGVDDAGYLVGVPLPQTISLPGRAILSYRAVPALLHGLVARQKSDPTRTP